MCATNAGIRIASKLYHREHIITVDRNSMLGLLHLLKDWKNFSQEREMSFSFYYWTDCIWSYMMLNPSLCVSTHSVWKCEEK